MNQMLDYAHPAPRQRSKLLAFFAHLTLAYPIFLVALLYGEWLLAWYVLGHPPRPSLDDPKYISVSKWLHPVTFVAVLGIMPAACSAVGFNALYLIQNKSRASGISFRVVLLLVLWIGSFALFRWDPGSIMYWWID